MSSGIRREGSGFVGFVRRHSILVFVALAYALSWWPWFWFRIDPAIADAPILPLGPLVAALIVLAMLGGWQPIKALLKKCLRWRIGLIWYAVALLLPLGTTLAAVELNLLAGAAQVEAFEFPSIGDTAVRLLFIFISIGIGEEIAWRGFLLDKLLARHTVIKATLIVALIHIVWHAPLFGVEYNYSNVLPWAISVTCFSIVMSWVYLRSGRSLLPSMLMHTAVNTLAVLFGMFEAGDQLRLWWLWCGLWVIAAIAVAATAGMQFWRERSCDK